MLRVWLRWANTPTCLSSLCHWLALELCDHRLQQTSMQWSSISWRKSHDQCHFWTLIDFSSSLLPVFSIKYGFCRILWFFTNFYKSSLNVIINILSSIITSLVLIALKRAYLKILVEHWWTVTLMPMRTALVTFRYLILHSNLLV